MADIYRKSVLEKLSSPDQLDRMIVITPPTFWLSMLGVAGITVVVLIWSIFGRLPVNVSGNGVLVSGEGMVGVYSEAQGVVAEITVSPGDTVTQGQVVAVIADRDTQDTVLQLERRIAEVEAITLTSSGDVMSADTQNLLEIKSSISTSDAALLQSQSTLALYEKQLDAERSTLSQLETQLANAKRDYYNSIRSNTGGTDLAVAYTNAEQAYQTAAAQLETAQQQLQSAQAAWSAAQAQVLPFEEDVIAAQDAVQAAQPAYDTAVAQRDALNTAQAELAAAEAAVAACDPSAPEYSDLVDALNRAQSNPDLLLTPDMAAIAEYEARSAALTACEADLAAEKAACDYDACEAAYTDAQAEYSQAADTYTAAQRTYESAKQAYDTYQSQSGAINADASLKAAVYQDAMTKYSTQQSVVASLEQSVLSARAQVNSEGKSVSTQAVTLGNQFETTKAAVLSQLRSELEQAERTLNKTNVISSQDGVVVELPVSVGTMVGQGTEIAKLSSVNDSGEDNSTVVVCYIPLSSGKKVVPGMTVMVYPTTVNKQEYGHMEATVLSVDNYVTSTEEIRNQLGDELLVQSFTQEGPVLAVTCELRTDDSTASGYYWSSAKAKDILLAEGTLVSVDVVIERKAPITMLIPFLKEKFSMEARVG